METLNIAPLEPLSITPDEAARLTSIGSRQIRYWIEHDPSFPVFAVGRKRIIPVAALREWLSARAELRIGVQTISETAERILQKRKVKEVSER